MSDDLNPSQRAAVEHDTGPMLVLAGAGSGKTRVVTRRIARLIERGVPAWSIVAMTFTNKAAAEMRERVAGLTGPKAAKELRVTTFHSFGLSLLTAEAHAFGFRNGAFSIFDQADCLSTVREILRTIDAGRRFDVAAVHGRISVAKNAFETEETWVPRENDEYDELARVVYPRYVSSLRAFQAFDFDDLVTESVRVLQRRDDIRQKWQAKIRYLLVDEYQDTNASQLELVRVLIGGHANVMVVGDDDQSIYSWRGADVRNILDFETHFSGAKVVKLEENYRSVGAVCAVANAVLAGSRARRHGKVLKPVRPLGSQVELVVCPDPDTEAAMVADEIKRALDAGTRAREVAVLYRSNGQAEALELALKERGVPHRQLGGQKFYERKEVKDLLAYLKVAVQPTDEQSLRRVINYPARGIGEAAIDKISQYATARDLSLYQAVERAEAIEGLASPAVDGCIEFTAVIEAARSELGAGKQPNQVATGIAERIKLREDVLAASPGEAFQRRWRNVETILSVLRRHDEREAGPGSKKLSLAEYLRFLMLSTEGEESAQVDQVTLATMHGAKGLEFDLVFVVGIEEGFLPHNRTLSERSTDIVSQDIEEERRLFYVGVTRAKNRLVLTRCKFRGLRGKPTARTPSRFLSDIPPELLCEREITAKYQPPPTDLVKGASSLLAALLEGGGPVAQRPVARRR